MVGGAISGYCAMGSVESAMTPTNVMTMLITPAKIGRSMKKCGKFMRTADRLMPSSFCAACFRAFLFRFRRCGWRRLGHSRNRHTWTQYLQTCGNDLLPLLKSTFHDAFPFEESTRLNVTSFNCVVRFHHEHVLQPLLRTNHFILDQRRSIWRRP